MALRIPRRSMMTAYAGGAIFYAARGNRTGYLAHMLGLMIISMNRGNSRNEREKRPPDSPRRFVFFSISLFVHNFTRPHLLRI